MCRRLLSLFLIAIILLGIVSCNGVGASSVALPNGKNQTSYSGLQNLGNSCYMNTALQLILHDDRLQQDIISNNPKARFQDFFVAYKSGSLIDIYANQRNIAEYIYSLPGQSPRMEIGSPLDVLFGNGVTFSGLGLKNNIIQNMAALHLDGSSSIFTFYVNYPNITVDYNSLPYKNKIKGLIYNRGGHYVAYIKENNQWYLFDDSNVSVINEINLPLLTSNATQGIEVVSYEN